MSDQARLDEIRTRAQAATPEPWGWLAYEPSTLVSYDYLGDPVAEKYGLRPRVLATGEYNRKTPSRHDADFIAHARQDIPDLLAEVGRLSAERDEYRRALRYLVGNEWEESAGDTLSEKAMSTVIDRQAAELSRLRAVIEEARDEIELMYDSGTMQHGSQINVLAILDRGLKGAGE